MIRCCITGYAHHLSSLIRLENTVLGGFVRVGSRFPDYRSSRLKDFCPSFYSASDMEDVLYGTTEFRARKNQLADMISYVRESILSYVTPTISRTVSSPL